MKTQTFLLVAVVVLAGCVGQPSAITSTNGVIIKSFTANPSEIESIAGESGPGIATIVSTVVQNVGEMDAELVTVKLTGLSPEWRFKPAGITKPLCAADAFIAIGEFSDQTRYADICRYYGIGKLFPADPSRGLNEGQETVAEWELLPPAKKEVEQTHEVGARLNYHYTSVFDSIMRVVSSRYFQQTSNKGGLVSSKVSGGPLIVNIKAPNFILAGTTAQKSVPIQIEIQNVGSGRVFLWHDSDKSEGYIIREPGIDDWDIVDVKVKLDNEDVNSQCKLADDKHARLINGKSGLISCKLIIKDSVNSFIDKAITVELTYNYVIDSTTAIRVLPLPK